MLAGRRGLTFFRGHGSHLCDKYTTYFGRVKRIPRLFFRFSCFFLDILYIVGMAISTHKNQYARTETATNGNSSLPILTPDIPCIGRRGRPAARPGHPRRIRVQALVADDEQRAIVRMAGSESVSAWLYALVRRELDCPVQQTTQLNRPLPEKSRAVSRCAVYDYDGNVKMG